MDASDSDCYCIVFVLENTTRALKGKEKKWIGT